MLIPSSNLKHKFKAISNISSKLSQVFVQNRHEPKIGSTRFQKRLNLQGTIFLRYCRRCLRPLDGEVTEKNLQTVLRLARRCLFPRFFQMRIFVYFPQTLFFDAGRKIAEPGGGKRVRRVRPDRLVSKNRSFIWEFTGRSPKTEHFSPSFLRF